MRNPLSANGFDETDWDLMMFLAWVYIPAPGRLNSSLEGGPVLRADYLCFLHVRMAITSSISIPLRISRSRLSVLALSSSTAFRDLGR